MTRHIDGRDFPFVLALLRSSVDKRFAFLFYDDKFHGKHSRDSKMSARFRLAGSLMTRSYYFLDKPVFKNLLRSEAFISTLAQYSVEYLFADFPDFMLQEVEGVCHMLDPEFFSTTIKHDLLRSTTEKNVPFDVQLYRDIFQDIIIDKY